MSSDAINMVDKEHLISELEKSGVKVFFRPLADIGGYFITSGRFTILSVNDELSHQEQMAALFLLVESMEFKRFDIVSAGFLRNYC